jgi:hypothetical protein
VAAQKLENRAYSLRGAARDTLLRAINLYQAGDPIHNPGLLPLLAERVTGSAARGGSCATCHPAADNASPTWNGRQVPHFVHARQGISCETCHFTDPPHHGALTSAAQACNECHHRGAAENKCATCHDYQANVYHGVLSDVSGALPSAMAAAEVACTDCHAIEGGVITRVNAGSCAGCHEASYADTLHLWQAMGDSLAALGAEEQALSGRVYSVNLKYQRLAAVLWRDGSRSVHNPLLFQEWAKRMEVTP